MFSLGVVGFTFLGNQMGLKPLIVLLPAKQNQRQSKPKAWR